MQFAVMVRRSTGGGGPPHPPPGAQPAASTNAPARLTRPQRVPITHERTLTLTPPSRRLAPGPPLLAATPAVTRGQCGVSVGSLSTNRREAPLPVAHGLR